MLLRNSNEVSIISMIENPPTNRRHTSQRVHLFSQSFHYTRLSWFPMRMCTMRLTVVGSFSSCPSIRYEWKWVAVHISKTHLNGWIRAQVVLSHHLWYSHQNMKADKIPSFVLLLTDWELSGWCVDHETKMLVITNYAKRKLMSDHFLNSNSAFFDSTPKRRRVELFRYRSPLCDDIK